MCLTVPSSPSEARKVLTGALDDANDAPLGVNCITMPPFLPHFQCFLTDPHFWALSPSRLKVHPLSFLRFGPPSPPHPLNSLRSLTKPPATPIGWLS